ncbi:MAG: hypothetical protein PHY55_00180 [Bacteroidales bacterium]|jgi:hypothetical protein|nr:hypothetical protein [Bacteroidales bacterium]
MAVKRKQQSEYQSQAVPTVIRANSRISVKINETFYTFEFMEERQFPIDLVEEGTIDFAKEKEMLWDEVHAQVDKQVQDVVDMLKQGK